MSTSAQSKICMVIGDPVKHSLSPAMHNAAYRALGIDSDYAYVGCKISADKLVNCIAAIKTLNIRGISCTAPHKITLVKLMDELDQIAQKIGAVNTIVNNNGRLKGYNTDWLGIIRPLQSHINLAGKKVALIGSGGAARAAAYGLTKERAKITIFNRTLGKAELLSQEFGAQARPLDALSTVHEYDIIILALPRENASSHRQTVDVADFIQANQIVFDVTYGIQPNPILVEAKKNGATVIDGLEMLLQQGMAQFKLFTGYEAPEEAMRTALMQSLTDGLG